MLVPELRFKEFKSNYTYHKLKDIVDFYKGNTLSKSDIISDGNIPCILYGELYTKYNEITRSIFSYTNNSNKSLFYSKFNDVLIPCSGETALDISTSTCVLLDNVALGGDLNVLRPKNVDGKYLSYLLSNKKRIAIAKYAQGDSIVHLYADKIKNIIISLPSLAEQKKVSLLLELLNKKVELQQKKIEVLKIYKKGLMQKIFAQSEINNWNTNILRNILTPGSKVAVTNTSKYQKITIRLNLQGITKSNVNREMADTRPFYIRRENEIIIGKQNYFNGSIAILPKEFDGCICSNAIMSFSVNSNYLTKFVYYYISQNNYIKRREYFANGTGQKELSETDFLNFQIKAPSIENQKHITNILDSIDSKIDSNVNIYTSLTKLKKSLLQQMFI